MSSVTKEAFHRELAKADPQLNLARAALLISEHLNGVAELTGYYLALLDDMAESLRPAMQTASTASEQVEALTHFLFEELDLHGNADNYYDPNNSFLDKVLDRRAGIPISLSMICLEIGWRLGLPMAGLGLPGHFIVGYGVPDAPLYIDAFNRGIVLSEDDCLDLARVPVSERLTFREQFLIPTSKKAILYRMLLNLKQIYLRQENWEQLYRTVDFMLIVQPDQIGEVRDRGVTAYRLNRLHEAAFDLQRYLFLNPEAPDANWLKQHLEMIEEKLSRLN
jgi:regulator of sirC expression with transglutaminase-like and TPR domain